MFTLKKNRLFDINMYPQFNNSKINKYEKDEEKDDEKNFFVDNPDNFILKKKRNLKCMPLSCEKFQQTVNLYPPKTTFLGIPKNDDLLQHGYGVNILSKKSTTSFGTGSNWYDRQLGGRKKNYLKKNIKRLKKKNKLSELLPHEQIKYNIVKTKKKSGKYKKKLDKILNDNIFF